MFSMTIKSNIGDEIRRLGADVQRHPLAIAKALTFTAEDVQKAEREEIQRVFDRPTPYTSSSLFKSTANPGRLMARVWFKDQPGRRAHYLLPQVEGGKRERKVFERYLKNKGLMGPHWHAVPGERAQLDAYGNWSRGQLIQVLSALQAIPDGGGSRGYLMNRSQASAKRKRKGKLPSDYFVGRPKPSSPLGVWERVGSTGLRPILMFVRAPQYRQRFKFYEVAQRVTAQRFPHHLSRALQRDATAAAFPRAA